MKSEQKKCSWHRYKETCCVITNGSLSGLGGALRGQKVPVSVIVVSKLDLRSQVRNDHEDMQNNQKQMTTNHLIHAIVWVVWCFKSGQCPAVDAPPAELVFILIMLNFDYVFIYFLSVKWFSFVVMSLLSLQLKVSNISVGGVNLWHVCVLLLAVVTGVSKTFF